MSVLFRRNPRVWSVALSLFLCIGGCAVDGSASTAGHNIHDHRYDMGDKPAPRRTAAGDNGDKTDAITTLPDRLATGQTPSTHAKAEHPLARFYGLLAQRDDNPNGDTLVRITQIGDSHTASDTFTGPVRKALQRRFGDGGRGYLYAGKPWDTYRQREASYNMSAGWVGGVGIRGGFKQFSLGGTRIYTDKADEWVTRNPCRRCTRDQKSRHLSIFYLKRPRGGSFDVYIDDDPPVRVDTTASSRALGVFQRSFASDTHTLRIVSVGNGRVTLFGTSMEDAGGVIVDSMGINGAQLRHHLDFNAQYAKKAMANLQPDLIILAFGANEAMSPHYRVRHPVKEALELLKKLQNYHTQILQLLHRYRSVDKSADCLLLLPPDMLARKHVTCRNYTFESDALSGTYCVTQPPSNYAGILNAERYAAQSAGCAVWDQQRAMGGQGGMWVWRELGLGRSDGVHLHLKGYDLLAEAFVADLMENYQQWRKGDVRPLHTHVIYPQLATTARDKR